MWQKLNSFAYEMATKQKILKDCKEGRRTHCKNNKRKLDSYSFLLGALFQNHAWIISVKKTNWISKKMKDLNSVALLIYKTRSSPRFLIQQNLFGRIFNLNQSYNKVDSGLLYWIWTYDSKFVFSTTFCIILIIIFFIFKITIEC